MIWSHLIVFWLRKYDSLGTVKGKLRRGTYRHQKRYEDDDKNGQGWTQLVRLGQLKTGNNLSLIILWFTNDLVKLWDNLNLTRYKCCLSP